MSLTKRQAEERAVDRPWNDGVITKVTRQKDGYSIETDGSGFFIGKERLNGEDPPKVGDQVATYTHRGSVVRGIDLRGKPLYYSTEAELEVEHQEWVAKRKDDKRKKFEKDRRKLDRQFAALPDVFQRRISWFRAWCPDFRWEYESYELSSCVDAVKIAEAMKTAKGVQRFQKASYKRQRTLVPDLYDGHSGNSFGMACRLAFLYLTDPLLVIAEHGAMVPLTGCEDYGCAHPRPADVLEAVNAA